VANNLICTLGMRNDAAMPSIWPARPGVNLFGQASHGRAQAGHQTTNRVRIEILETPPDLIAAVNGTRVLPGGLFVGDAHFLDHARILGELIARQDSQFLRRTAAHRETQLLQPVANIGVADRLQHFGIEPGDDLLRRTGGSQNRKP
jgi:hypothetical protein